MVNMLIERNRVGLLYWGVHPMTSLGGSVAPGGCIPPGPQNRFQWFLTYNNNPIWRKRQ